MEEGKCKGCFMGCKPYEMVSKGYYQPFPCSVELRTWAEAHRDDRGDELGYVREAPND